MAGARKGYAFNGFLQTCLQPHVSFLNEFNLVLLIERTELIASMREMAFLEVAKPVGYKRTEPEIFDAVRERAKY